MPGALQHLMGSPGCRAQLLLVLLYEGAQLLVVELRVEVVRDRLHHQICYKMDNGFADSDPVPDPVGYGIFETGLFGCT